MDVTDQDEVKFLNRNCLHESASTTSITHRRKEQTKRRVNSTPSKLQFGEFIISEERVCHKRRSRRTRKISESDAREKRESLEAPTYMMGGETIHNNAEREIGLKNRLVRQEEFHEEPGESSAAMLQKHPGSMTNCRSEPNLLGAIHAPMARFLDQKTEPTTGCMPMIGLGSSKPPRKATQASGGKRRRHTVVSQAPLHLVEMEALSRRISADSDKSSSRKSSAFSNVSWADLHAEDSDCSDASTCIKCRHIPEGPPPLSVCLSERRSLSDNSLERSLTSPEMSPLLLRKPGGLIFTKEEYTYRQVLRSVLNPLGVPDQRPGYRPLELAYHLKEVFVIGTYKHESCVAEAQNNKMGDVVLDVQMVEARNLEETEVGIGPDPYCVLALTDPKLGKISPRGTPMSSPRTSPIPGRRKDRALSHDLEVRRTQILKDTQHPRWNEEFEMGVHDLQTEELHVFIWDDKLKSESPKMVERNKPSGLINFIKNMARHSFDGLDGYIGHCKLPLRDIPATGYDEWYVLYEDRKQRTRAEGECRLRVQLTTKLTNINNWESLCQGGIYKICSYDLERLDCTESDMCSIEDYNFIVKKMYMYVISDLVQQDINGGLPVSPIEELPGPSSYILQQFASQNHLTKISQTLMELVVILECLAEGELQCVTSEKLLKSAIVNLEMEWLTLSSGSHNDLHSGVKTVTDTEMNLFAEASAKFIKHTILHCEERESIPKLFPPQLVDKASLNKSLGIVLTLLNLHIWNNSTRADSQQRITNLVTNKLQEDIKNWCELRLSRVQSTAKDAVLPEIKILAGIIDECVQCLQPLYSINQEFSRLELDYYRVASLAMEPMISGRALELMLYMDQYQLKYHRYPVNIRDSSQISLQLCLALKRFSTVVYSHLVQRDVFRVSVFKYQDWFNNAVIFWLQTFKEEGIRRMEKALEIDKDVVQVTSLLKYSNSSVDVLSVFTKIVSEWVQIDFQDADIALLGVTKITDAICDGLNHYVNRIEHVLEKNCYYDFIDNQQFDITDQLCITLNNISHVQKYLEELPSLLKWEEICENMSLKHENKRVGFMALQTLRNLVVMADEEVHGRVAILLDKITDKIADDLYRYTIAFIQSCPDKTSSVDGILDYLNTNLSVLVEKLDPTMFPRFLEHIWKTEVDIFTKLLVPGKPPEYYWQMHSHLGSLKDYIQRGATRVKTDCYPYKHLVDTLKINSLTSTDLIVEYNKSITSDLYTPLIHFGHLELKLGIREFFNESVTIETKVIRATELPSISKREQCSPFVSVNQLPVPEDCPTSGARTVVVRKSGNPRFEQYIAFSEMPKATIARGGVLLSYSVWHHGIILPDEFLGEISIPVDEDTPYIGPNQTIDDLPALIMPLKRSREPTSGPYKVLRERVDWDHVARDYLDRRSVMAGHRKKLSVCAPVQFLVSFIRGRNRDTQVVGTNVLQKSMSA